jgi:hypothetical protein
MALLGHDAVAAAPVSATLGAASAQGIGTPSSRVIWPGTSPAWAITHRFLTPTWAIGAAATAVTTPYSVSISQASAITISNSVLAVKNVAQASAITVGKSIATIRSLTQASALTLSKSANRAVIIAQASIFSLKSTVFKVFSAAQVTVLTLVRSIAIAKSITAGAAVTLVKSVATTRIMVAGTVLMMQRAISVVRSMPQATAVSMQRAINSTISMIQGSAMAIAVGRAFHLVFTLTQSTALSVVSVVQRVQAAIVGGGDRRAPGITRHAPTSVARPRLAKPAAPVYDVAGTASSFNGPQTSSGTGTVEIVPISGEALTQRAASSLIASAEVDNRLPINRKRAAVLAALLDALTKKWR